MKKMLIVLISLFGYSCGDAANIDRLRPKISIESDFQGYVDNFILDSKKYSNGVEIKSLIMKFTQLDENNEEREDNLVILGACYASINHEYLAPLVVIEERYWFDLLDAQKELLIYHELGHCLLQREHTEIDFSVMTPSLPDHKRYTKNKDKFLSELFDENNRNTIFNLYGSDKPHICGGDH